MVTEAVVRIKVAMVMVKVIYEGGRGCYGNAHEVSKSK